MATYLALFRGINIGGHHKLAMTELVSLLEDNGCRNTRTYIQSGNAVFETRRRCREKLAQDIREAISDKYGFSPTIILLTKSELQDVIANNPFPVDDARAVSVMFLAESPEAPDLERLEKYKSGSEGFVLGDRVFYLYTPDGAGRSKLAMNVERCLGVGTTGRNWNTVCHLASMLESS